MRYGLSVLIVGAVGCFGCTSAEGPRAPGAAEAAVPSAPLSTLEGATTDLGTVVRGHAALVSLWATWCDACVDEIRALNQLEERSRPSGDGLVVGVAVGESRETVGAFAERHRLGYPLFVDEHFQVADALGERKVPATLVVNRQGHIVFRGGGLDRSGLAAFREALSER